MKRRAGFKVRAGSCGSRPSGLFIGLWMICAFLSAAPSRAQTRTPGSVPGAHKGAITALLRDSAGRILSAGEDGFLQVWNDREAVERFRISPYVIQAMALRPGKSQISVVENDGLGLYRVSAWDYETKQNLFTLVFRDSISFINYSAAGGFLIVARSGRSGAAFIHSETGEVLESPNLPGSLAFAATGRSERIMICYHSTGTLSYWNLESGTESNNFLAPPFIQNPVLFGNNRFLGGFDSEGLVIVDSVTGGVLARYNSIRQGRILIDNPESTQFACLATSGRSHTIYRMDIDLSGRLAVVNQRTVPSNVTPNSAVPAGGENYALGTGQGAVWLFGRSGARRMDTGSHPERLVDIAASSSAVAFITEKNTLGFVPLDFTLLKNNDVITLENLSGRGGTAGSGSYTGIIADPADSMSPADSMNPSEAGRFLLWQPGSNRSVPMIRILRGDAIAANTSGHLLDKLPLRFPLRSAAVMANDLLFLDTAGSVSILDMDSGDVRFSYSAAGSVDAAFVDRNRIILGRTAAAGNTPFMTVDSTTGETVPLAYPAMIGIRVYRGESGAIYGAAINQVSGNMETSIIRLDPSNPANSERLVEYAGEDSAFIIAESGGNLASNLGGGGATLYRGRSDGAYGPGIAFLERSMGLPVKLLNGNTGFIALDSEGGISWHDNRSGRLLAVLRFYQDTWVLETPGENGSVIRGRTAVKRN